MDKNLFAQELAASLNTQAEMLGQNESYAYLMNVYIVGAGRGEISQLEQIHVHLNRELRLAIDREYRLALLRSNEGYLKRTDAVPLVHDALTQWIDALCAKAQQVIDTAARGYVHHDERKLRQFHEYTDRRRKEYHDLIEMGCSAATAGVVGTERLTPRPLAWLGSPIVANIVALLSMLIALVALVLALVR